MLYFTTSLLCLPNSWDSFGTYWRSSLNREDMIIRESKIFLVPPLDKFLKHCIKQNSHSALLNFNVHINHLVLLLKWFWDGAWNSAFLITYLVIPKLLDHTLHFDFCCGEKVILKPAQACVLLVLYVWCSFNEILCSTELLGDAHQ